MTDTAGDKGRENRPAVELREVEKSFPGVRAVRRVSLVIEEGEVHGLVGENGAGKSTLVKMIAGAVAPDGGNVFVHGVLLPGGSPSVAREAGVAAIYQEPNIVPKLSPVANVFLGQERSVWGVLSENSMRRRFKAWCAALAVDLPLRGLAETLSIGAQQAVEIVRALEQGARIVIMDEPTAALSTSETEALHRMVATLRARGAAIVFISHKLEEVLMLCDRVTVMRDGEKVMSVDADQTDVDHLVAAMLGEKLKRMVDSGQAHRKRDLAATRSEALRVESLEVPGVLNDVDLTVQSHEVLGIAGLVGSGRTTLLRALAGAEPTATGRLTVDGKEARWPLSPAEALRFGIVLAPEDRRAQGLILSSSAAENACLPSIRRISAKGLVWRRRIIRAAEASTHSVGFPIDRLGAKAATLSGGNQQKLVLAKWLLATPRVLLVDEPVRGIDVGAKAEIFALLRDLADQGLSVIMVSEETEELIAVVDRLAVLSRGRIAGILEGDKMQLDVTLRLMFPVRQGPDAKVG